MESAESAMREAENALHTQTLKLENERSARMADGKARIKAAIAARTTSQTSEQLRKTAESSVAASAPPAQGQQESAAAAAALQSALERKTSEVVGGEPPSVGRAQDFFNAAATAANASISASTVAAAAAAVGASAPPSNATAAASADALAMAALAANTASEPVAGAGAAPAEHEKTSEEMQTELARLNADPLLQEAEARRLEFLAARGAVALPTLENATIPAGAAAAASDAKPETKPFDPNVASLLMSPQMSSKATNLMASETERPLPAPPAASSIAKALRSDLAFRKEVPMKQF